MKLKKDTGFTLIELLVVIAIIALLLAVILPALGKAKVYAQRVICANHVRQQGLGITLYANENDSYAPNPVPYSISGTPPNTNVTIGGGWFWDVSFWFTNQLCEYAGFEKEDTRIFTCPSNKMRKPDDSLWWQFVWSGPNPPSRGPSTQPLADETVLNISQQRASFRVAPYLYLLDRYVKEHNSGISLYDPRSNSGLAYTKVNGQPMEKAVVRRFSNAKSAGSKPIILDAIISAGNNWQFSDIQGGLWNLSSNTVTDDTNHLSRQSVGTGTNSGPKPDGMNIAFADGHAGWKSAGNYVPTEASFENVEHQYSQGMWFWW